MQAMILAAGLGTRLRPLTGERPKPMFPLCNQALVRWVASGCAKQGFAQIQVNLHHLGSQIRQELGDGDDLGAGIRYYPEPKIMGTGGAIRRMFADARRDTVLVVNGKIVHDVDLRVALASHRQSGAMATMVVHPVDDPERWGAIGADENGRIHRVVNTQADTRLPLRLYMFTGIHLLEADFIARLPQGPSCVVRQGYQKQLLAGAPLNAFVHRGYFQDHSTVPRYLLGSRRMLSCPQAPVGAPKMHRGVDASAVIASSAQLVPPVLIGPRVNVEANARIGPYVTLGGGASVAAGVTLADCLVWPDCRAGVSVSSAVVAQHGVARAQAKDLANGG